MHTMTSSFFFILKADCDPEYKDDDDMKCQDYIDNNWCTNNGEQGSNWELSYGPIDEYFNTKGQTPLVCPQCGCGKGLISLI